MIGCSIVWKVSPSRIRSTIDDYFRLYRSQKTMAKRLTEKFRQYIIKQCKKGVISFQITKDGYLCKACKEITGQVQGDRNHAREDEPVACRYYGSPDTSCNRSADLLNNVKMHGIFIKNSHV